MNVLHHSPSKAILIAAALLVSAPAISSTEYVKSNFLTLHCPTGYTNTSRAGNNTYHFVSKSMSTPGFLKLCTENKGFCQTPQLIDRKLYCYYSYNDLTQSVIFYSTTAFKPQQDPRLITTGLQFLPLTKSN